MEFDEAMILAVWEKGHIDHRDPTKWRKDACGAWMSFEEHENQKSSFGWRISRRDGDDKNDALDNFQPLQWQNHVLTAAAGGHLRCAIAAKGDVNVSA